MRGQVLGTAKNAIVVWIGIVFLGEAVTLLQGVGYAISLGGFAAYNYLKMQPDPAGNTCWPSLGTRNRIWPQLWPRPMPMVLMSMFKCQAVG